MTSVKESFKIQGMVCRQCADIVERALLQTRGVIEAKASYWRGSVEVEYDPELAAPKNLKAAVERAGYGLGDSGVSGAVVDLLCAAAVVALVFAISALKAGVVPKAQAGMTLGYLFVIGLLTSTHCLGMCGGILLSQTTQALPLAEAAERNVRRGVWASLAYNGGRVASYTAVGAAFGAVGAVISYTMQVKSMVFTIAGVLVVLIGLQLWGVAPWLRRLAPDTPAFCTLPEGKKKRFYGRPLAIGLLTGVMPCGALAAMWAYAMGTGSAGKGAAAMLVFALGTVPLMFVFGAANAFIPRRATKYMVKCSAVLVVALGLSMLLGGLKML